MTSGPYARKPQTHILSVQALKLHYLEWPVVHSAPSQTPAQEIFCLHGYLDQSWTFADLVSYLPQRVVAWDARGHGNSDWVKPHAYYHFYDYLFDLHQALKTLMPQPILLGHSMGGMIASLYAGIWPAQPQALISLEGWIVPDTPPEQIPQRIRTWVKQRQELKPWYVYPDPDAAAERLKHGDPLLRPEQALHQARHGLKPVAEGWIWKHDPLHRTRSPQPFRLDQAKACWQAIRCPTLLCYGAETQALTLPDWDARLKLFPEAQIRELGAAGHNLHLHQPAELAELIQTWLNQQS